MNELLKSLACSGTECFCWILVLFNILAVFYLVFCSFWKVSRLVKIFGWVHSGVLICIAIITLFYHTCIYTLLATLFTGMMLLAILSIVLQQQGEYPRRWPTETVKPNIGKFLAKKPHIYVVLAVLTAGVFLGYVGLKRKKRGN